VTVEVRDAQLHDAPAIARIHVECWRHAYAELVPKALLDGLDVNSRTERWQRILGSARPPAATLVSVEASGIVTGFASVDAARDDGDATDPSLGELQAIYLAPPAIGTGTGRVLLAAATDRMRDSGFTSARLDVLPGNARARQVYEAAGWTPSGEPWIVAHGEHDLPHQRYVREL